MTFPIRPRTTSDLPGVGELLTATHHSHAYPVILLEDMAAWGAGTGVLEAWVAVDPADGRVVGHVSLAEAEPDDAATLQWQDVTGLPLHQLGVVRRLVVHERAQGHGTGTELLATTVAAAHRRGLRPVLDMADNLAAAGRLYERAGFEHIGAYDLDLTEYLRPGDEGYARDGEITHHLHVLTWIGPEPPA
ncbi:MAG: acyltransferase [Ilumatobacteraceae bacterium]|nr:acyltransferase [Ilumatobacteraceae bacterium]